jgi:hypothetical protein
MDLKLASGCSRLFTATNSDKQELDNASGKFACFATENWFVSVKIP